MSSPNICRNHRWAIDPEDQELYSSRYHPDGLSTAAIAERLGVTQREVQRVLKVAHAKIKRALEQQE
jgi:DNA-directed RNA polymerase specialized sigma subunit